MENYLCICSGEEQRARATLNTAGHRALEDASSGACDGLVLEHGRAGLASHTRRATSYNLPMSPHPPKVVVRSRSLVALVAAATICAGRAQAIGPNDRRLSSGRTGITVEAPAGWSLSQRTGYSDTVVLLLHPDGSRISISSASTSVRQADELYQQNRPGLIAQGLVPTVVGTGARGSLTIDLGSTGRSDRLRQLYLVRNVPLGRQAIVLTLATTAKAFDARVAALELVASRLTLEDPVAPTGADRPGAGAGGAAGGAGGASPGAPSGLPAR